MFSPPVPAGVARRQCIDSLVNCGQGLVDSNVANPPGGPDSPGTVEGDRPMNFAFSEEQEELRSSVRRFLEDKSPMTEVRRLMETTEGYDPAVWKQMGEQLGLQAIAIPEEYGGAGFGYVELTVIFEEMGAALLCAPYFSTVALAANALLSSGDESAKKD